MKTTNLLPTSAEITQRLRTIAELRSLCLSLGRARRAGDATAEAKFRGQDQHRMQPGNEEK